MYTFSHQSECVGTKMWSSQKSFYISKLSYYILLRTPSVPVCPVVDHDVVNTKDAV